MNVNRIHVRTTELVETHMVLTTVNVAMDGRAPYVLMMWMSVTSILVCMGVPVSTHLAHMFVSANQDEWAKTAEMTQMNVKEIRAKMEEHV